MLNLHPDLGKRWEADPFVVRITTRRDLPSALRPSHALLAEPVGPLPSGFRLLLIRHNHTDPHAKQLCLTLPEDASHLKEGDIVRVSPRAGTMAVLYRSGSPDNAFLLTERCNCRCVMCAQPPKHVRDNYLVSATLEAIELIQDSPEQLGLTGGEPTLLGEDLIRIVRNIRSRLPQTVIHLLSNARLLKYPSFARELAKASRSRGLLVGIPLHSDLASEHNRIAGCPSAFDETVLGILNLHREAIAVELRFVIHRESVSRIREYAYFVQRNLPFVRHVAFMGLEVVGWAKARARALWIDPAEYVADLEAAVDFLDRVGVPVSIFNVQLCLLSDSGQRFARASISDWKKSFLDICDGCSLRLACCGFFGTDGLRHSRQINPRRRQIEESYAHPCDPITLARS